MGRKKSYLTATDQFCGAGGTTTGIKKAGVEVKMALNHWKLAIDTHNTNHPEVDHDCTDVQACDPRRYPSTDILVTSPECTNHSLAQGMKRKHQRQMELFGEIQFNPDHERSRATMWDVPRFAEYHNYEIIVVENVVDAKRWALWDAWLMAMHSLGYEHKTCYFNSMHFLPCPQSRDRLYVVFWKKGNKAPDLEYEPKAYCMNCEKEVGSYQAWKKGRNWGKYKQQYLYRCLECYQVVEPYYYAAFNVINWNHKIKRIGDRKRPLSEKTMRRIVYGLEKYGNEHLILNVRHKGRINSRVKTALDPMGTATTQLDHGLLSPFLINVAYAGANDSAVVRPTSREIMTQTTSQSAGMILPFIVEMNRTGKGRSIGEYISTILAGGNHHMLVGNYSPGWVRDLGREAGTVTATDHHGLLRLPIMVNNKGRSTASSSAEPMRTVTSKVSHGILSPESFDHFLSYYNSKGHGTSSMADPVRTMTGVQRASLVKTHGIDPMDCFYRMLKPDEIQRAMGFPDEYEVLGNQRDQTKQLGNAVTPQVPEWIGQRCIDSLN